MGCEHDWRGGWHCRKCQAEDRRGPKRIAELEALLRRIDAVITWETTPLGRGFQDEIEAILGKR